jgi:L-iditol 2-dehydrogenase
MKAAYVKAPAQVEFREVPIPELGPLDVLVKIAACGVCGTDVHFAFHLATDWQAMGHELSGVVAQVGPAVTRVRPGDRVTVECDAPCGQCADCRRGYTIRCKFGAGFYAKKPGYAEYITVPELIVVPIGDLDLKAGALIEPFTVALGAVDKVRPTVDDTVLVIGPGTIGLMALATCRMMGARKTILAGRSHSVARLKLGEALGADRVVRIDREYLATVVAREFPGGVDKIINTGHPSAVGQAVDLINKGGIITYIGRDNDEDNTQIAFNARLFHFKGLELRPFADQASPFFCRAAEYLKRGVLPVDRFITHIYPLEQVEQALKTAAYDRENAVKVVVTMDGVS